MLSDDECDETLYQWQDLRMRLSKLRNLKPLYAYVAVLQAHPEELTSILVLVKLMMTMSSSTAQCERSFSLMNQLKTNLQTTMSAETLSSRIRVACSIDSLTSFNAEPVLQYWLTSGGRKQSHVEGKSACDETDTSKSQNLSPYSSQHPPS